MSGEIDTARLLDVATRIKRATRNADLLALCEGIADLIAERSRNVTAAADSNVTVATVDCPKCAAKARQNAERQKRSSGQGNKANGRGAAIGTGPDRSRPR
jgi:hypothetical protein